MSKRMKYQNKEYPGYEIEGTAQKVFEYLSSKERELPSDAKNIEWSFDAVDEYGCISCVANLSYRVPLTEEDLKEQEQAKERLKAYELKQLRELKKKYGEE